VRKESWRDLLEKYALVKKIYLECEETDPQLKTNLQPFNEFRAVLDHICSLLQCEIDENTETGLLFHEFISRAAIFAPK